MNQPGHDLRVGSAGEITQPLILDDIDLIDAVGVKFRGELFDVVAQKDGADFDAELIGERPGTAAQLEDDIVEGAFFLLGKDPDFAFEILPLRLVRLICHIDTSVRRMGILFISYCCAPLAKGPVVDQLAHHRADALGGRLDRDGALFGEDDRLNLMDLGRRTGEPAALKIGADIVE